MFVNKKIFVLGMARSGFEVAKLLSRYNNEIVVTDKNEQDINDVYELEKLGVKVIITDDPNSILDETFDVMVKNPGIKYNHETVLKAHKLDILVVNELEVAASFIPDSIFKIGVTGSNGKTTTVTLINEILKQEKDHVHLCGNIGYPVSSMVKDIRGNDIMVIEISDHQLCDMYNFKTDISILTNISETHIDFHDSYDRYKMMKKRIFNNHTHDDLAIINYDNDESMNLINDIKSRKMFFSSSQVKDCYIKDNIIYYKDEEIINTKDIKLKGKHNYENIMAAILVVKELGISNESINNVLTTFKGVEHRIEYVCTINNRLFYNDSKSTNNKATMTALSSFDESIILLMGGLDRNIPFDDLIPYMSNVKLIACFGETKEKIKELADQINIECHVFNSLKEATIDAYNNSEEKDVILLSPACASWDQYKCFEDRGNEFKEIVSNLK